MSRVVEYVGVLHLLKDHVKETWTQFWANFSSSSDVNGGEDEKESNFRGRIRKTGKLGFFLTPLLGSLSDGCRSQLGRRRPFIILLSIGIILGLIMVPNGKTIGRMLGDTYIDDEPPDLKVPSELASHLLVVPPQLNSEVFRQTPWEFILWDEDSSKEVKLSYKQSSSKHAPTEYEHGFRAWNSLTYKDKDLDQQEFLKTLSRKDKSQKINHGDLERFILQATQGAGSDEDEEDLPENSPTTEAEERFFQIIKKITFQVK
ncbi:Solute carrier family 45 member 4 [Orchesella cincta]|uniref:Solute carrier family 45 member 4 n=1 Tax=Orchesella cincta TaxID=48709 RepID=A0A1D2M6D5_ORCCI|nr:Solute carrier family 45 member 4 [Orchesella cincta]